MDKLNMEDFTQLWLGKYSQGPSKAVVTSVKYCHIHNANPIMFLLTLQLMIRQSLCHLKDFIHLEG